MVAKKYGELITGKVVDVGFLDTIYAIVEEHIVWGDSLRIQKFLETHDWPDLKGQDWGGVEASSAAETDTT